MLLRTRLSLLIGSLILVFLISGAMVWTYDTRLTAEADDVVGENLNYGKITRLASTAKDIKLNIVQVQQFLTDISATRGQDGLDDGTEEAATHAAAFETELKSAQALAAELKNDEILKKLDDVKTAFPPYYATGQKMAAAYVAEGPSAGNKMMAGFDASAQALEEKIEALLKATSALEDDSTKNMGTQIEDVLTANHNMVKVLSISGMACLLLFAIIWFISDQRTMKPISVLIGKINDLSKGNLDVDIPQRNGSDEIAQISKALLVFKTNAIERKRLEMDQERQKQEAEMQRRAGM